MRIATLEEIGSIGDNATRFKALWLLRRLYPKAHITLFGCYVANALFAPSNIYDSFVNIEDSSAIREREREREGV